MEDYERRIRRLEEEDQKKQDILGQLVTNTAVMNATLDFLSRQLMPKVQSLEVELSNALLVIRAIKWLAMATGGSAVLMILAYLFGGGSP